MAVKVYGPVTAGCPQRVLVCLVEMGVDFEVVHVDLETGDHKKPEFLPLQVIFYPFLVSCIKSRSFFVAPVNCQIVFYTHR